MKAPVRVTVTGAAGQIGYALLFRIASGSMLGDDQPVILQLLDITPAMDALGGVKMSSTIALFRFGRCDCNDDPEVAFKDCDYALLVGARPRGPAWSAKTCWKPMRRYLAYKAKPLTTWPVVTSKYWLLVTLPTPTR